MPEALDWYVMTGRFTGDEHALAALMDEHVAYLHRLMDDSLLAAAPVGDTPGRVRILRGRSADEVAELVRADPFCREGLLEFEVHRWPVNDRARGRLDAAMNNGD